MTVGQTVAVIGAGSFIGRRLTHALTARGHRPLALTRREFDVTDHDAALPEPIDAAIFLAQDRSYTALDQAALGVFDVNTVGVLNAVIKARDAGAGTFLFTSTGNVYAPSFEALHESSPLRRADIYSTSKIFAEQILDLAADELRICRARLFGAYGPHQTIGLLAGLTNRIRNGDAVSVQPRPDRPDDGGFTCSLTHVDDIAAALGELVELGEDGALPPAINLAAHEPTDIATLARLIGDALGTEPTIERGEGVRSFDLIADTTLSRSLLRTHFRGTGEGVEQALRS